MTRAGTTRAGTTRAGTTAAGGSPPGRVVVVGGGLAGLAAAVGLADAGADVTLLESRGRLGGATHSFRRDGLWVDNGQHVFLRCCTAYLDFLRRLGVEGLTTTQPRLSVPVVRPGSAPVWLRRNGLPAPLHLAGGLARYRQLCLVERARSVGAVLALRRLDPDDPRLDAETFGGWLARHGQSADAVDALWDLVTTATLNARPDDASLKLAVKVFTTGLLAGNDAADIGFAAVPLQQLHGDAAERALLAAGGRVVLRSRVRSVRPEPAGPAALTVGTDDGALPADAVVVAVPHDGVDALLPPGTVAHQDRLVELGTSPIVNVHVVYDRRVTDLPYLAGIGTPLQWLFDRTRISGLAGGGGPEQYLAVSISAADGLVDLPTAQLREQLLPELERMLPLARAAQVASFFVTRERAATFRQVPGSHVLRAPTRTALPGVVLAGAWTDTGWPATMEGAVRSGQAAADAVLTHLARSRPLPEGAVA